MASSITIKVGGLVSTFEPTVTDAKVAAILRRFVVPRADPPPEGATQAQINQHYLDQALREVLGYIVREAQRQSIVEAQESIDAIHEQARGENAL